MARQFLFSFEATNYCDQQRKGLKLVKEEAAGSKSPELLENIGLELCCVSGIKTKAKRTLYLFQSPGDWSDQPFGEQRSYFSPDAATCYLLVRASCEQVV